MKSAAGKFFRENRRKAQQKRKDPAGKCLRKHKNRGGCSPPLQRIKFNPDTAPTVSDPLMRKLDCVLRIVTIVRNDTVVDTFVFSRSVFLMKTGNIVCAYRVFFL